MDRKILIVDDEKTIVDILKFKLEKEGFHTVEALSLIHISLRSTACSSR